jgi:hypothetical protein
MDMALWITPFSSRDTTFNGAVNSDACGTAGNMVWTKETWKSAVAGGSRFGVPHWSHISSVLNQESDRGFATVF